MVEEKRDEQEENLRYKYIGFDVYPLKAKRFWKSGEEEKAYLEEAKKRREQGEREERDHSLVFVPVFTPVDKLVLTISSVLMILSLFLPWFSFTRGEEGMRYNAFQYLLNLGATMTYSGLGGALLGILAAIFLLMILSSLLLGILNLTVLYGKKSFEEKYLQKLKKILRLNSLPFLLWLGAIIIAIIGVPAPLASAFGINQIKDNLNVVTLVSISGYGLWISLGCWIINSIKANDI